MSAPVQVAVTGPFDDPRSPALRFLQEAARLGAVTVLLWTDDTARELDGRPPKFPLEERAYFLRALRYVKQVLPVQGAVAAHSLPGAPGFHPGLWALEEARAGPAQREFCAKRSLPYRVFGGEELRGFPPAANPPAPAGWAVAFGVPPSDGAGKSPARADAQEGHRDRHV